MAAAAVHVDVETHAIGGLITRQKIQELPLNGRSFLQLAFLEPGVTASPGSTSQYNSLFSVSILGGDSNKTAITVDGGNVRNSIEGNTGMNFSQEVIQEFQLSVGQLRSVDRHHQRRRGQHRDAQRRQRPARLRLLLLSRSRHGARTRGCGAIR